MRLRTALLTLLLIGFAGNSHGQDRPAGSAQTTQGPAAPKAIQSSARQFYVEFRSRSALSYGHTFLVHGKLNAAGQIGQVQASQVAGLHPATESSIPWTIGHLVPVISETGASDGDTEEEYVTARYRVSLTQQEYADVSAYIVKRQKNSPLWHAVLYNCNAWVADIAKYMGLKTPESTMLYPADFINGIAELNAGRPNAGQPTAAKPERPAAKKTPPKATVQASPAPAQQGAVNSQ